MFPYRDLGREELNFFKNFLGVRDIGGFEKDSLSKEARARARPKYYGVCGEYRYQSTTNTEIVLKY
jgi:hypothetical protein